jgi:rubredoxin
MPSSPSRSTTSSKQQWFHCPKCGSKELFYKPAINHQVHLILVVLTAGFWLVSYLSVLIGQYFQPWICSNCSHPHHPEKTPAKIPATKPSKVSAV